MNIITIDGPASSGKGTVAKILASRLGYNYLDSGSIYRSLALMIFRANLAMSEEKKIIDLIQSMHLQFLDNKIYLNSEDITEIIRQEQIGMLASKIAKSAEIRKHLLEFQRSFFKVPGLVTDGRDMGSVVFPDAKLKIFLTATSEIRTLRRYNQLQLMGISISKDAILRDILQRDKQDIERKAAPLIHDQSFTVLDNSNLSIEETVNKILDLYYRNTH